MSFSVTIGILVVAFAIYWVCDYVERRHAGEHVGGTRSSTM
jgi:hypothetical protein